MAHLRLRIVGESVIEVGEKRISPTSPQLFALLLYLGTENNRDVPRAELMQLLYPAGDPSGNSAHRLRQSLYKLKGMGAPIAFGDRTVRADGKQISSAVSEILAGGWETRRERLSASFEILPHYIPPSDTALSGWIEVLRDRLSNALCQYLTRDMEVARRKADWRYLEAIARRTLELDPLNESAVLGLAEAIARTGSKARAVSVLDAYRTELGEDRSNLALPASLLEKRIDASRERAPARREPIRLIGRERELESLLSQWHSARRGHAHLLWLTGNKSVGKSRLVEEVAASVLLNGSGRVVTFSMSPLDVDRPLSLFATLANRLSSLPGAAGCHPASLQALGKLSGSISIPNTVNPDNTNSTFTDAAVRNAVCDLLACVTDEKPILVVVDDAEHVDEASSHLLGVVLSRVADKRLLIVLSGIAEGSSPPSHTALHVDPLSLERAEALWTALIEAHETRLPDDISRQCLDAAAGNPGHLELLAQQAAHDPEQFQIPVDIVTLIERRLRQLSTQARYVLEAIVILEDAATPGSVSYLTGLATFDLLTALNALESGDLVINTAFGLRCRSGLINERVRKTLSGAVASVMEGRAAEYFERDQSGDRWSPAMAWRIGAHWQRAGEQKRARAYLRACWQHAVSVGQPASACADIKEALTATTDDPEGRASLLDDLIGSSQAAGDTRGVISAVIERKGLSTRVHDTPTRVAELAFDADEARWLKEFDPHRQVDNLRRHLESPLLNPHRRIRAARMLMISADLELDPQLASYAAARCERIAPENPTAQLLHRHVSLIYHTIFGDRDRALQIANELENEANGVERSWYTLTSRRHCIFARQLVAPGPPDYDSLERGFAHAIDASMTVVAFGFAAYLTSVLVDDGDIASARTWLATCENFAQSCSDVDFPADYFGAQIDLALIAGNWKKARHHMQIVERCWAHIRSLRVRNALQIYRLRVQQHCDIAESTTTQLEELLSFHEVGKRLTRHDDHMEVLWTALNSVGQSERASSLLSEYVLHHRRERGPVHYMLRHRTGRDPAWQRLDAHVRASSLPMN